jgi:putative protease
MNTLIKDSELSDALNYAATLYKLGVDALIIQDMGFAALVRKHIPDFELHLSTRAPYIMQRCENGETIGLSRVVLARELTLNEIREITDQQLLEIEVFAHGALCICYSGQCQRAGRSGAEAETGENALNRAGCPIRFAEQARIRKPVRIRDVKLQARPLPSARRICVRWNSLTSFPKLEFPL